MTLRVGGGAPRAEFLSLRNVQVIEVELQGWGWGGGGLLSPPGENCVHPPFHYGLYPAFHTRSFTL